MIFLRLAAEVEQRLEESTSKKGNNNQWRSALPLGAAKKSEKSVEKIGVQSSTFNTYGVVQRLLFCYHRFHRRLLIFQSFGLGIPWKISPLRGFYIIRNIETTKMVPLRGLLSIDN